MSGCAKWAAGLGMGVALVLVYPASAQRSTPGGGVPGPALSLPDVEASPRGPLSDKDKSPDPLHDKMEAERVKAQNDDRHKRLVADANRLLALATELKTEVDKTNKNELSVVVVRKAAEMEKLSKDLKERMRD